jgi:hypothetical protein
MKVYTTCYNEILLTFGDTASQSVRPIQVMTRGAYYGKYIRISGTATDKAIQNVHH